MDRNIKYSANNDINNDRLDRELNENFKLNMNINHQQIDNIIQLNKNKFDKINLHFDFYYFINYIITPSEKEEIETFYLNNSRFCEILSKINNLNYSYLMGFLNLQMDNGNVMNGIKETIRSIELKKAKLVFIAEDCEIEDYSNLVIKLCVLNEIRYVKVLHWSNLRDIIFKGPTTSELEEIAMRKGKPAKITPKCNSAVVLYTKEELEYFTIKQKEKETQEE